jgi:Leucine-rich repeat (LRR) protein
LSELETLSLQDNWVAEVPTGALIPLRHLRALSLAGNPVRELLPTSLAPLSSLRALDMSRCGQLAKLWPESMAGLGQLTQLNFSYNTGEFIRNTPCVDCGLFTI